MKKSIVVVGAGMGGLAAGIYGQLNGYDTTIFEQHSLPGGQCATWKRKGYSFDGCIHHLFSCEPGSKFNGLWQELGAMPRELARTKECVSAASPDSELFIDYYDPELLERHLKELSPGDSATIEKYARTIPLFARNDFTGEAMVGSRWRLAAMVPGMARLAGWFKPTMQQFAERFSNLFLKRAFPLIEYSFPEAPLILHMAKHAYGYTGGIAWPVGVRLADGSAHRADVIISNADGRKTIMGLLEGRHIDEKIRRWCEPPDDVTNWAVHVFLGVNRDLSGEPSALVQLLDKPLTVADHTAESIEMQMYGFDPTMAPEGKGVIKVELFSSYSYWKKLYADRERYDEEKQKVAETIIDVLDRTHFPGIKSQVEVVDVPTLMTWERYVGGTHGFQSGPKKKFSVTSMLIGGLNSTLPGLSDFYLVGTWATAAGGLFANALSGRRTIETICRRDGKAFASR